MAESCRNPLAIALAAAMERMGGWSDQAEAAESEVRGLREQYERACADRDDADLSAKLWREAQERSLEQLEALVAVLRELDDRAMSDYDADLVHRTLANFSNPAVSPSESPWRWSDAYGQRWKAVPDPAGEPK